VLPNFCTLAICPTLFCTFYTLTMPSPTSNGGKDVTIGELAELALSVIGNRGDCFLTQVNRMSPA